ncbi:uroporphyrinogen-III synthase [Aquisalinus flavus]|uniref:Tetrapyrrole biosynthesis uroporphyrinogen III synthase domain-containing protein n=1 Tax=Aquisalinus flavus TaxID=1526572 RepID=A0A8J2V522_9PROT|nr:uroporphyrinogen-III synthase [Aquisalinus flavus]MBD0425511.1 uroporphyrinogen-III synthase [Aquisalinus flavus]UNE48858.1 uroporphyrinogen-III synthase [Aquisalinus flavus]GGD15506.1 hypothetical protein GCM10011342_25320 [Aquisalinus flavus]
MGDRTGLIVVTRPQPDADLFARQLNEANLPSLVAPLIDIDFETTSEIRDASAVAVTSANGVRALARATTDRSLPVYAVGPASAGDARRAGFAVAGTAESSVESLAALIAASGERGPVLHVTGSHQAGDLVAALSAAGISAFAQQLYRANAVRQMPVALRVALTEGRVDAVTLFSPRTARLFRGLVEDAVLSECLLPVRLICLSPAVANALSGLRAHAIIAAGQTDARAVIDIAAGGRT